MKKILGFAAAVLLFGMQNAYAVPMLKLTLTQASGTAGQCASLGGTTLGAGVCGFSTTGGIISVIGSFGSYQLNQELAVGYPLQPQPAAWLNSTNATLNPGSITVTLVAQDYTSPVGSFILASTASGTYNAGTEYTISSYFDAGNTGVAGAGSLMLSDAGSSTALFSNSIAANYVTPVTNPGAYSVSWVMTATRTAAFNGEFLTVGVNSTFDAVPAPLSLSLLGFGLLGLGAARRRTK
ncbi:MAG: hypothetical protein KDE14_09565 [Rhodobacteraceae bacterium]|nr:hypothetical protein [Paracoccaceae bacterium]